MLTCLQLFFHKQHWIYPLTRRGSVPYLSLFLPRVSDLKFSQPYPQIMHPSAVRKVMEVILQNTVWPWTSPLLIARLLSKEWKLSGGAPVIQKDHRWLHLEPLVSCLIKSAVGSRALGTIWHWHLRVNSLDFSTLKSGDELLYGGIKKNLRKTDIS